MTRVDYEAWRVRRRVLDRAIGSMFLDDGSVTVAADIDSETATVTIVIEAPHDHPGWTNLVLHLDWRD